jgi:hypothetical protein
MCMSNFQKMVYLPSVRPAFPVLPFPYPPLFFRFTGQSERNPPRRDGRLVRFAPNQD